MRMTNRKCKDNNNRSIELLGKSAWSDPLLEISLPATDTLKSGEKRKLMKAKVERQEFFGWQVKGEGVKKMPLVCLSGIRGWQYPPPTNRGRAIHGDLLN
ncbi:hypothetical protein DdX_05082 [Ditylenchus destructor]|uniref:Uncharacterized protein n=1 Tax=Ditylenchus destructor TaxID=166010 RepID=A0AAD4R441_9BILA|nr:hypothetical protein DdX_05082 [Ditylenchus destructor]